MNIAKLKNVLITKIQATESNEILEEIHRFLEGQEMDDVEVYQLNDMQRNAIAEGREDIKKGCCSSNEEVEAEFKQWLKE